MNAFTRSRRIPVLVTALLILLAPAFAQKKKAAAPPPAVPEQHQSQKPPAGIRDILSSLQGQQTNHGLLTRVTGDYVVFEQEGDTLMYPLATLQVVKFLKADEGEPRKIEIRFLSKD